MHCKRMTALWAAALSQQRFVLMHALASGAKGAGRHGSEHIHTSAKVNHCTA